MIRSRIARDQYPEAVAEAASRGWITTEVRPGVFGRRWLLTPSGLQTLVTFHNDIP